MGMTIRSKSLDQANKAVVAFLDGRRLKGYIYNFSALKSSFTLFLRDSPVGQEGIEVKLEELKAVFFCHDFDGNREYQEVSGTKPPKHGRSIEVVFRDGERLRGNTDAYNPQKLGFFMFPTDPKSNNIRVFVVSKNALHIQF
ncbi:MAG TPA: hypothetical protein VF840_11220 [Terriglobales bacterium]